MAENTLEEMLKKIIDNPDVMSKVSSIAEKSKDKGLESTLPEIIEAIAPQVSKSAEGKYEKTDTSPTKSEKIDTSLPTETIRKLGEKISNNSSLLLALKPYLSKERGDMIDNIVKMAQIADLMKLAR